ncbi:hypothetical protein [Peredibacter starrii]|uniref:Uncharacterized protein n=1 Tax=Peredibacter starrii TaxID=28202 RepID=A0AAX4HUK2_9BACT|nr:hypothetical protein [Peredibacter starrii]WPU66661.1 hypothetical protein SOO65_07875 [Peredibacter starrii]
MSSRPFDYFHDSLLSQYRELIREAILESEIDHKLHIDMNILSIKVQNIIHAALIDGISELEVRGLLAEAQRFEGRTLKVV